MRRLLQYLNLHDDSMVGDIVFFVAIIFVLAFCLAPLVGCSPLRPMVVERDVQGIKVVDHIDTDDAPDSCGDRSAWGGCHVQIGEKHHIWRSSFVSQNVIAHEDAHVLGMRHTAWTPDFTGRQCATVLISGGQYKAGQMLCVGPRGEEVINMGQS